MKKEVSKTGEQNRKRVLGPAFSSYHGKVHISNITIKPKVFANRKIYINSVCAGHVVVDESDMFDQESSLMDERPRYRREPKED